MAKKLTYLLPLAAFLLPAAFGQSYLSSPRRALVAPELLDAPDEWIRRSLLWTGDMLQRYPPALPEVPVRRAALIRLDDVLHIASAPEKPLVQEFFRARMEAAVAEIKRTRVDRGMRIWKLYNHGFFVRTPTVSFVFDVVPGPPRKPAFAVGKQVLEDIASEADALFLSHMHDDHVNESVATLFLERNKPVVAPEGLWAGRAIAARVTYPKRSASELHSIPIQGGKRSLRVVAYPGHQGASLTNNVHLVTTPEGLSVLQTGDQSNSADFEWIDGIGRQHKVDVLLPNCWTTDIRRMAAGVNPRLIVSGHENEMAHTVDHREDYTQTYDRLFGVKQDFLVMTWGETYHYGR